MKILLAFVGNRDPYYIDEKTNEQTDGPILSLLSLRKFEGIELFYTTDKALYAERAEEAWKAIIKKHPSMKVQLWKSNISDPISHREIMSELRRCIAAIQRQFEGADYFIYVSPGTPQMHSAWLLLAGSDEIPAKLLQTRDPRQQKEGQKPIEEIDPKANWFPHIAVLKHDLKFDLAIDRADVQKAIAEASLIGSTETIKYITDNVAKAARSDACFLISGESGTGKEVLAQFIHQISLRRDKNFIAVNCSALPDNLIESELFGYEKGAYTGATKAKPGKFKIADKGTLFLDEIGDMSLSAQVKILRAIQEKTIEPLGSIKSEKVDVRIIAATNKDLKESIQKGLFREDLYYRINVIPIKLKPLRERRQDIGILANYFVQKLSEKKGVQKILTSEALQMLCKYSWPGNIRELRNAMERAYISADKETITPDHCILGHHADNAFSLPEFVDEFKLEDHIEKYRTALIDKALKQTKNQREAARLLGVTDAALSKRKKRI